ncbi:hypothetical protein C0991_012593 [Blastosporella zonata]|nr:hypothetical protein C0991_012593 [Blastosporella zonata]
MKNRDPLNAIDIAIDMSTVDPSTITHDLAQLETIVFLKKWEGLTLTDAIPKQLKKMPVIVNGRHYLKTCHQKLHAKLISSLLKHQVKINNFQSRDDFHPMLNNYMDAYNKMFSTTQESNQIRHMFDLTKANAHPLKADIM